MNGPERFRSMRSMATAHQRSMGRRGDGVRRLSLLAVCAAACAPRVDLLDDYGEGGSAGAVEPPSGFGGSSGGDTGGTAGLGAGDGPAGRRDPPNPGGSGSAGTSAGTSGTAGSAPSFPSTSLLSWNDEGGVNENQVGIAGGWYSFDDCGDATPAGLPCTERDPNYLGPDGSAGWWIESTSEVCARGVAPRVDTSVADAYALQWGLGIGLALDGGMQTDPVPYDAIAQAVIGFVFDVTGTTGSGRVRFNLATPTTQSEPHHIELQIPVQNRVVYLEEVTQGPWVSNPVPFTPNAIRSLQVHVATREVQTTPFDFCVRNLRVLRAP